MKTIIYLFFPAVMFIAGCTFALDQKKKSEEWMAFNQGLIKGAAEKKPAVIDFYTDWCHWCKVMDEKTFSNPEVKKFLQENFITVKVQAESTDEQHTFQGKDYNSVQLTRAFGISGFPSLAFLDSGQNVITVMPGYIEAPMFLHILKYIKGEYYKKQMSLEDFIKKNGK
ncbi:MAG: hypothetical protein A2096_13555 [Spirochaetes bacterium GWF1_41_5]|nr:MAG: hypothetical protein A2096_13555 [Spirochaetes bacterium GWF1_41_5]HBE03480.1 hypothetical protein [Spirochaetia bacterium]